MVEQTQLTQEQLRTREMGLQQIERLDQCIKMNDESLQLQNQVAEELDAQNDTLNRIDRNLDRTDANLQKSGKTIKAIKRPFWTAVKSMFVTEKPEGKDPHPEEERQVNSDLRDDKQVVGKGEGREGTAGTPHHVDPRGLVTKQDEQLDTLLGQVRCMKAKSQVIGQTLTESNQKIERINGRFDKTEQDMQKNSDQLARILK